MGVIPARQLIPGAGYCPGRTVDAFEHPGHLDSGFVASVLHLLGARRGAPSPVPAWIGPSYGLSRVPLWNLPFKGRRLKKALLSYHTSGGPDIVP